MKIRVHDVQNVDKGCVLYCSFKKQSKTETFIVDRTDICGNHEDLIGKTIEFDFTKLKVSTFKAHGLEIFANYIDSFKIVEEKKDFVAIVKDYFVFKNKNGDVESVKFICKSCSECAVENVAFHTYNIDNMRKTLDRYNIPNLNGKRIKFFNVVFEKYIVTPEGKLYEFEKFEVLESENVKK